MLLFCHGMIRSGSSTQHRLACALIERARAGRDEGLFSARDMDTRYATLAAWGAASQYHIVRLDEPHPAVTHLVNAGRAKLCYAFRDIRDVAVLARRAFGYNGDVLLERLQRAVDVYYVIHTYEGVLSQQYEELVGAIDEATDQMDSFLGLDTPPEIREQIADRIRFGMIDGVAQQTVRSRIGRLGRVLMGRPAAPGVGDEDAIGGGRRDLPADEARRIEMRFGGWLRDAGYETVARSRSGNGSWATAL